MDVEKEYLKEKLLELTKHNLELMERIKELESLNEWQSNKIKTLNYKINPPPVYKDDWINKLKNP